MDTKHKQDAKIFKAFCDENRLQILDLLRSGEKCACKLLEYLNFGQSSLSYHMKILVESGIVESRQEGKWTHYQISQEGGTIALTRMEELITLNSFLEENQCCVR